MQGKILVEIYSDAEEKELETFINRTHAKGFYWLGLRHSNELNGDFIWISTGLDTKNFSNWRPHFPQNQKSSCGVIQTDTWMDTKCESEGGIGICQEGISYGFSFFLCWPQEELFFLGNQANFAIHIVIN